MKETTPKLKTIMLCQAIKKTALFFGLLAFFSSCARIDTDPHPIFCEIQEDVSKLTDQNIYWDSCLDDFVMPISIGELLEKELTEEFAVHLALLNNRNLQALYHNLGIAKAQLVQAGLLKNPIFSFAYRFSTKSNVTDLIDAALFQNFLEILLIPSKKRLAQAELEATKNMIITRVLDLIADTKIAFFSLQAAEQIWNLKKQILLASELSYEAAQRLFAAGNIKDLEVSLEQSNYDQAKMEVASWEILVLQARERLNVLMGLWGTQIDWKISSNLPLVTLSDEDFKNIENEAIANSIDLKIAHKELLATAASFGIDTSRLIFPQAELGVSSEREESIWYVGPAFNLAIPIFDFGHANSAKARAKIMQQWNEFTALAVEIRSMARLSRFSYMNAHRQAHYLKEIVVPLAEKITHTTLLQHNAMQLGIFILLAAKQREFEKKIQSVQMQRDYWISRVVLQTLLNGHVYGHHLFETPLRKYYE